MNTRPTPSLIYRDPTRPIPERVRDLLERMTLDEKIAQLGSAWVYELLDGKFPLPESSTREPEAKQRDQKRRGDRRALPAPLRAAACEEELEYFLRRRRRAFRLLIGPGLGVLQTNAAQYEQRRVQHNSYVKP